MGFASDLNRLCEHVGDKAVETVRKTAMSLQNAMIERSPVGNPSLWLSLHPYTDLKSGKQKTMLKPPVGYVGGRFKANWQCGIGVRNAVISDAPGSDAKERTAEVLSGWVPGQIIYLTNSLPYSLELEYGHSSQAANGMVRLTVQEYSQYLKKVISELK